jgi:hypothetical protein
MIMSRGNQRLLATLEPQDWAPILSQMRMQWKNSVERPGSDLSLLSFALSEKR